MDAVSIFVTGVKKPVIRISRLELAARSRFFYSLLRDTCEGCSGDVAVIIEDEDWFTVEAVLSQVAVFNKRRGVSIIPDKTAYEKLMSRLEIQKCYIPLPPPPIQMCVNQKKESADKPGTDYNQESVGAPAGDPPESEKSTSTKSDQEPMTETSSEPSETNTEDTPNTGSDASQGPLEEGARE